MAEALADDGQAKHLILVLGGARSGKSAYAEKLAARIAHGESIAYVATATASDNEMRARITRHQAARPAGWRTLEAPTDPAGALAQDGTMASRGVVLLDCLTILVANLLIAGPHEGFDADTFDTAAADAAETRAQSAIERLLALYYEGTRSLVLVSNEVGMGLVPDYALGRVYRDVLGRVNARVAAQADAVLLMVAGLPVEIKALADAWNARARSLFDNHL